MSDWSEVTHNHILEKNNELTESFLEDQLGIELLNKGISAAEILSFTKALTELSYDNYGRTPKRWIKASTEKALENDLPEKLALTAEVVKKIIQVLGNYVQYLDQIGYIKNGEALQDTIQKSETKMVTVSDNVESIQNNKTTKPVEVFMPHDTVATETSRPQKEHSAIQQHPNNIKKNKKVISLIEVKRRRRLLKRRGRK
ncbi:hypothetical protein [Liquorilactobacillus nagelii]|uniref:hypothetical protein n=1 Tax=Liquorilactobacillus nagelii TaxID=82688 RepID=UPI0039E9C9AA